LTPANAVLPPGKSALLFRRLQWSFNPLPRLRDSGIKSRLAELAASATETRRRTEPEFLQLAGDLRVLHEGATELGRTTREHVASVHSVLEKNRLAGSGGLTDGALSELQAGLQEAEERLRVLRRTSEAMRRLHGQGRQMQRVASLLEVSGYGFAVESARSVASQQAFSAFVDELRKLARKVGTLGEAISDQARTAQEESERLGSTMAAGLKELGQLTLGAGETVRQTSARVQSVLDASWTALQDVERNTTRIAGHASDAVYHLQFGDIVRQKLEHVSEALTETNRAHLDHQLQVQAGQLELVVEEIASARQQLDRAFASLADETHHLASTIQSLGGGGDGMGEDPLAELRAGFTHIEELQKRGRHLCIGARETSARAMETAAQLSHHLEEVEEINRQMHLQALNAIIKTALLGDAGRTLEILSMHVHGVFMESSALVAETVEVIAGLSRDAESCAAGTSVTADHAAAPLQHDLDELVRVQAEFRDAIGSAAELTAREGGALDRARVSLGFLSELGEQVDALRRRVIAVRPNIATAAAPHPPELANRYTIASEREVHRRVTQSTAETATQEQAPLKAASGNENIDLFDDPAPPENAAPQDEDLGDNVELF